MPKCYQISISFSENTKGLSVVGKTDNFLYIMFRNGKTGEIGEELIGKCRNVQVHPVHADVKSTFGLFNQMFEFDKEENK